MRFRAAFVLQVILGGNFIGVLCPISVLAWSENEHAAIAIIAEKHLSDHARGRIRSILGDNVGLAKIASCADALRMASEGDVDCGGAFRVAPNPDSVFWHFIPIPLDDSPSPSALEQYCNHNCSTDKIKEYLAVLRNKAASRQQQQVALLYVVHLVGDLHQPLHCVRTASQFGGTEMKVAFMGWKTNLHWLWDTAIETDDQERQKNSNELAENISANFSGSNTAGLSDDVISNAAVESFQLAKDVILPNDRGNGSREFGASYREQMQPLAYGRMVLAGQRLAQLLEEALR